MAKVINIVKRHSIQENKVLSPSLKLRQYFRIGGCLMILNLVVNRISDEQKNDLAMNPSLDHQDRSDASISIPISSISFHLKNGKGEGH